MTESVPTRRPSRADAIGGAALLFLAVFAAWAARDLPFGSLVRPGPGFFPLGLAAILAALGLWILLASLRLAIADPWRLWASTADRSRVLTMATALVGYTLIVDWAGFSIATFLLFLIMLRGVAGRSWTQSCLYSAVVSAAAWLFFARLLRVNLPAGILF